MPAASGTAKTRFGISGDIWRRAGSFSGKRSLQPITAGSQKVTITLEIIDATQTLPLGIVNATLTYNLETSADTKTYSLETIGENA